MKTQNLRGLLAVILLTVLPALFAQDAARTFTLQDGAHPWYDRDAWTLAKVPAALKGTDAVPQQNCSSRSLDIPGAPAAITVGVFEKDIPVFLTRNPAAQKTADTVAVVNTAGTTLNYTVFTLAQPAAHIDGTGFTAGLILLKITAR